MTTIVVGTSDFPQSGANRTRSQAITELLDYVGGVARADAQARAGRVWDAAVKEYNTVCWVFNRMTNDILLDSTMLDNTAAPTLGRDTGSGTGFTLTSGTTIDYWVEERVKSGNNITKRNVTSSGEVVTLTGDGSADQPVITRPTTVNVDATHWALYASAAGQVFPSGAEISEVAIATTTIEDVRTGNNPALPTGALYNPHEFDLTSNFRSSIAANVIDANGIIRYPLRYIPWSLWTKRVYGSTSTVNLPYYYTVRNVHETGQVIFDPRPSSTTQYPIIRIDYFRRILTQASLGSRLNVPQEVDEAIFQLALAKIQLMVKGAQFAKDFISLGLGIREQVEWQWRDYTEDGK